MSENLPDFDNMSPEEMQTWLESLAKRQGASEGFTTSADMDVAEIDPNSVVIDEPGYVPYGEDSPSPRAESQAPPPAPAQLAARVTPEPVSPPAPPSIPGVTGTLAWLESLAADRSDDLFNLDLSDAPAQAREPEPPPPPPAPEAPAVNPISWLEDLARSQVAEESLESLGVEDDRSTESEKLDPFAQGVNPMEWLETLAKRQGAKDEELTTSAHMNIPEPVDAEVEQDDYQPFSFDTPPARRSAETAPLENPAEWLESLAGDEGYSEAGVLATQKHDEAGDEDMSMSAIQDAISTGTVTREQMQHFLEQQSEQLENMPEALDEAGDDDMPPVPAELPDWLSEMKPPETTPEPSKPIEALFDAPPAAEVPDWLRPDFVESPMSDDIDSIFEPNEDTPVSPAPAIVEEQPAAEVEVDPDDPWTEAFDVEYEQGGELDVANVPDWYDQNIHDPERIAAVEEQIEAEQVETEPVGAELEDAALPDEKGLAAAQPQAIPAWMTMTVTTSQPPASPEVEPALAEEGEAVFDEIPDWLKEVESSVSPEDVPEWLVETITEDEPVEEPPAPEPVEQMPAPPPTPAAPPPPAPAYVPRGDAAAVFERAREREQTGDLDGALADYEAMIRSNTELDAVVADLTQLIRSYKTTPAVYRVLGDGLMRQGKLQAALNTYREALNQL